METSIGNFLIPETFFSEKNQTKNPPTNMWRNDIFLLETFMGKYKSLSIQSQLLAAQQLRDNDNSRKGSKPEIFQMTFFTLQPLFIVAYPDGPGLLSCRDLFQRYDASF